MVCIIGNILINLLEHLNDLLLKMLLIHLMRDLVIIMGLGLGLMMVAGLG